MPQSNSLDFTKAAEAALASARSLGADAAEVYFNQEHGFSAKARDGDLEKLVHHREKGFDVSLYVDQRVGSASIQDLSPAAIENAVNKAFSIAQFVDPDPMSGLADPALLARDPQDLNLHHTWSITPEQAIQKAIQCERIASAMDKRIMPADGASVSTYEGVTLYANSDGFVGSYPTSLHRISCTVVAEEEGDKERDYEYSVSRDPNKLNTIENIAAAAVDKTVRRFGAQKLSSRQCPVIYHATAAKSLLGHFVAAIRGQNLYRHNSFLLDHIGKQVFPDFIQIQQQPHLLGAIGSAPFDHEGVATKDIQYIENGTLMSYALGSYSARQMQLQSTGNAGGVFNLSINSTHDDLKALLKAMGTGLLVTELIGQGVSILTGDYSRGAFGYWVEQGEIQYPVHEITIAGMLKDIFKGIVGVGGDVDSRSNIRTGSILLDNMVIAGT